MTQNDLISNQFLSESKVSVVIPTVGREQLLTAVQSVLSQTYPVHEILVVADTLDHIQLPESPKVQIIRVGPGAGGNVARQAGIEIATGNVIALLDDDDAWLPKKLEVQLHTVSHNVKAGDVNWLCSTRVIKRAPGAQDFLLPVIPFKGGKLTHYLFRRTAISAHHGFIQASTMLFPRDLVLDIPFDKSLKFHQDISWLIDVTGARPQLKFIQCWDGLVIYNTTLGSVSKKITPQKSITWAQNRFAGDRRIMGDFILTQSLGFAKNTASLAEMLKTLWTGISFASPGLPAILYGCITTLKSVLTGRVK